MMNSFLNHTLNLVELFASVQGETSFTGFPTTFIRLAACNLRCTWCDTPYSFGKGISTSFKDIFEKIELFGCKHICVTGGEPLLQEHVYFLMEHLCDKGFIINLETGGSLSTLRVDSRVHIILDIKCPGSKMDHKNCWSNLERITPHDEVKFVLVDLNDYNYAKEICTQYNLCSKTNVLFSPVHNQLDPKQLISWILEDKLKVRLNLQLHKYIWTPTTRGV